jgi:hypothetical protein
MSRLAWIISCGCFVLAVGCPSQPPKFQEPNERVGVNAVLAAALDQPAISGFVGAPPAACIASSPRTELCQWSLGARELGWASLARAIGTRDRINLLCELPTDGRRRTADACSAYPQRSNRVAWSLPAASGHKGSRPVESREVVRSRYREEADRAIAAALTLVDLSRLMGAAPDECTAASGGLRFCLWRTTNRTFGHGTLAMWIGASKNKKIRLRCMLPDDGSPRGPGSCSAEVGA